MYLAKHKMFASPPPLGKYSVSQGLQNRFCICPTQQTSNFFPLLLLCLQQWMRMFESQVKDLRARFQYLMGPKMKWAKPKKERCFHNKQEYLPTDRQVKASLNKVPSLHVCL